MSKTAQWPDAIEVPVSVLHENPWNPNDVDAETMEQLAENVKRAGFNQPLVVRPHPTIADAYEVVDGAHRLRTAQTLGMETVPVIVRPFNDGEAKLQTIAMNKLRGEMDPAAMAQLIREAESDGIELGEQAAFVGFNEPELTGLLEEHPVDFGDDAHTGGGGSRGRGEAIIAYNLVFDDAAQQDVWFAFIRHLKATYDGETVAERLTKFLSMVLEQEG